MSQVKQRIEETLDPKDWNAFRALAHHMLDEAITYQETARQRPVWQPVPDEVKTALRQPAPQEPTPLDEVCREFIHTLLPHPAGNIHPRFWGWVIGNGSPTGFLAEMLAAGINSNAGGGDQVSNYVEQQVIAWLKEVFGFPPDASGLLVSGGSMANLTGLTVALNAKAGFDVRREGLVDAPARPVFYASVETHSSNQKAVELLGLGSRGLRLLPADAEYRLDVASLEAAIARDRQAGLRPVGVIANAGTVNTGAFDDLNTLADLCAREDLWLHVDGAFGAMAHLAPELRHLTAGIERADSLAFDMHKWMYMPYVIGCTLVRSEPDHRRTFTITPEYLEHTTRGMSAGDQWWGDYGIELSRNFRALKAWMMIKETGMVRFGRLIRQNVEQAQYLARLVDESPVLERIAPAPLNIVCFRFSVPGLSPGRLNALNQELLLRLHEGGKALVSYTTLNGKYALRAAVTNHRSRRADFDLLVDEVVRLGKEIQAEG